MSELGERFAREEMEREMRDEELAEALGLEGKALEDFWRRRREIQSMQFMIDLEMDPAFQSPASKEVLRQLKIRRYEGDDIGSQIVRLKPKNPKLNTLDDLFNILLECWCKETAYPSCQKDWSKDDPSYGQCAITAMLVHDLFGGTIHRTRNLGGGTHYFNKIGDRYIDLTAAQFLNEYLTLEFEPNETIDRKYCGRNADTKRRYDLLISRIANYLSKP
jgi:hypothetical protein